MRMAGADCGRLGSSPEVHAGLGRRPAAFPAVARHAAGDDVLPVLAAALGDRHDVIERQLARWEAVAAVLALMIVARVDVRARERHVVEPPLDLDVAEQADDRRQLEAEGDRADLAVVDRDDLDLPLAPKRHRFLPVDDLERLVRRVQEKRLFQSALNFARRLSRCQSAVLYGTNAVTPIIHGRGDPRHRPGSRSARWLWRLRARGACASATGAVPRPFPMPGGAPESAAHRAPTPSRLSLASATAHRRVPTRRAAATARGGTGRLRAGRHGARAARRAVPQRRHRSERASTAAGSRSTSSRSTACRCRARSANNIGWGNRSRPRISRRATCCSSRRPRRDRRTWRSRSAAISSCTRPARPASSASSVSARATGRRAISARAESRTERFYAARNWPLRISRRDVSARNWRTWRSSSV